MRILKVFAKIGMLSLLVGFRASGNERWDVSVNQPAVWLNLDAKLYATDGFGDKVLNIGGELGSLKNIAPEMQRIEIWKMILQDFDSVKTSFLRLRVKPGLISEIDAQNTITYDDTYAKTHTISIIVGTASGLASGDASPQYTGSHLSSCKIVIGPTTLTDPVFFKHVLTHEIIHCLGFSHEQEDTDSVMSYSNNSPSLGIEERMALTYAYPVDAAKGKESATYGLACTPGK